MDTVQQPLQGLIDTHFHLLEMQKRGIDIDVLLSELHEKGFHGGIDIGISATDVVERFEILQNHPCIRMAAGIGPWGAQGDEPIEHKIAQFEQLAQPYALDCIGEVGLDNYWNYGTPTRQEELFIGQIELAQQRKLPVVIHTRDADEAIEKIIRTQNFSHGGILHCFSSSWEIARIALDKGFFLSFAGPITYRKNDALRNIMAQVPLKQLLLETDSPYLSPEPYRGKVNTPLRMVEIYQRVAMERGISIDALASQIRTNFAALFPKHDILVHGEE